MRGNTMRIVLIVATLFLGRTVSANEAQPRRIVCIGDSVTKAAGVKKEETFCAAVQARLTAAGRRDTVINSGVGSDTTDRTLKRFEKDVLDHKPTHCFIMLGLNDAYRPKDKGPHVPLDRYA